MIRCVLFGCQQIAVDVLKHLHAQSDVEIPLVVTYELPLDKTYGYESLLEEAGRLNLSVEQSGKIDSLLVNRIESLQPDVILSVYYRKIFPKSLLAVPHAKCVNIHPSFLPFYRGATPTAWALVNGEQEVGVTIHYMDEGIDTGDILVQQQIPILYDETGFELYTRVMKVGADLLKDNFYKIVRQELPPQKQRGPGSYYGRRAPKYKINWQRKAEDIRNVVRVHAKPYNPAESVLLNKYVLVNRVSILSNERYQAQTVGRIVDILDDEKLVVSCADGCLVLEDFEIVPAVREHEYEVYYKIGNKFE